MTQPELFDVGERLRLEGEKFVAAMALPHNYPAHSHPTPALPGTGPEGETCRTCANYCRVHWQAKVHLKCGKIKERWTHGLGTDIKASWPACSEWEAAHA